MEVYEVNTQRFEVALELLREGDILTFDAVDFRLSADEILSVNVNSSWWIENTNEERALSDLKRAKDVLAYVAQESPEFARIIKNRKQEFTLSYFDGRDGVLLGRFVDGKILWT
jgi:hypothetical protein